MKVIVVGCGRIGSALAYQMGLKGHQVTVIDQDVSAFDRLPVDFHGRTIKGDVLARNVLNFAEIEDADALAAVTSSDSLNALIAFVAKTEFEVSNVVARNFDLSQRTFQEAFGVPVISSLGLGVNQFEELLSDAPLRVVYINSNENFAICELKVPESWNGRFLHEFLPDDQGKVFAITRAGKPLLVSSPQSLETGDLVYFSTEPEEIEKIRSRLYFQQDK